MFHIQFLTGAIALTLLVFPGCQTAETSATGDRAQIDGAATPVENGGNGESTTLVMKVYGMSCPLCATNIDKQLLKIDGVNTVQVNLGTGEVVMQVSKNSPPDEQALIDAVDESGFTLAEPPHPPRPRQ